MARAAGVRRSGPGYAGLIVFIVLCIALIVGYVVLVPEYAKVVTSLDTLHQQVNKELEARVGGQLNAKALPRASKADIAYDTAFFRKIGDSAEMGLKYPRLVELTGWPPETAATEIEEYLKAAKGVTTPDTLRKLVDQIRTEREEISNRLNTTQSNLQAAEAARDQALGQKRAAEREADKARAEKEAEIKALNDKYQKSLAGYKSDMEKFDRIAAEARKDLAANLTKQRAVEAEHAKEVQGLKDRIAELEKELARKKPKPVAVTEGRILQVDLINKSAIINLGRREGIAPAEKFKVIKVGVGGERSVKGEIQVVHVQENIARADILSVTDPKVIIVRDDIVQRVKKEEEAPE